MKYTGDNVGGTGRAGRIARAIAACAFALAAVAAHAAPPAGTLIPNQATGSARLGGSAGATQSVTSNTVAATVGTAPVPPPPPPPSSFNATLDMSSAAHAAPGGTVYMAHVLTNTGLAADTYKLTIADLGMQYSLGSLALFVDADGDGKPDNQTPITAPVTLQPGQAFHFVARLVVPGTAQARAVGAANVIAESTGGAKISPNRDTVEVLAFGSTDCGIVQKSLSRNSGPSPGGPITVTLTYQSCTTARSKLVMTDFLPSGMKYVPGSGRWSGTGATVLTDGVNGDDRQGTGSAQVAYDFNVSAQGAVTATVFALPIQASGYVKFDVTIDSGLATGTVVSNTAAYVFYNTNGVYQGQVFTNSADYTVNGTIDLTLTGDHQPSATPGTTASFKNVLTNRGSATETFDITFGGSTFPAGTTFALYKADGTTPLADTDGNATVDSGPLAPGASFTIVLKAQIPATAAPGAYKVTKTARSVTAPARSASADDAVDAIELKCLLDLDGENQALVGRGQHVTYPHYLTNRGNCTENVQAMLGYLSDTRKSTGWSSSAYVDNAVAGGGSLPGAVDPTDTQIQSGWKSTLAPGQSMRLLVDVLSPDVVKAAAATGGTKKVVDSDITTLVIVSSGSGTLTARDTTLLDDGGDVPQQPVDAVRNFTDNTYTTPTLWGVVGGNLWLRADAPSCNADPTAVERHTITITGPNGEQEQVTAVETGPNTGVFVAQAIGVRNPPVTAGDGTVEGTAGTTFDIEVEGCSRRIENVVTLMAPGSVVFDSVTNAPVPGAIVTLVQANGPQCGTTPVAMTGNPITTDPQGNYSFPPVTPGTYCLAVQPPNGYHFPSQVSWPHLPAGHNLSVTGLTSGGSYGNPFPVAIGGLIVVDVPVDSAAQSGLFVQKAASKASADVGEFVDYTVTVHNGTGNALAAADVVLGDDLPAGFGYVAGTARRDGQPLADPPVKGPHLAFTLGHLVRDQQTVITYRVRIGPGSMQGDGTNRAQATYIANGATTVSNVASARVQVTGGVFSNQGFILGKVFLDCNANGVQDAGEMGVAGVRILIEDGTYVITDSRGQFSFYGLDNRTHVVKADRATLPAGGKLVPISARNLGDGGSRIVDLKAGEMARADFALGGCDDALVAEVKARDEHAARDGELAALAGTQLTTTPTVITDVKALPASGLVTAPTPNGLPGAAPTAMPAASGSSPAPFTQLAPTLSAVRPSPAPRLAIPAATPALEPLEKLVPDFDRTLAFVGLADGDTLPYAQATIRVKGTAGSTFRLTVNGVEVSEKRVGKRATLAEKQVQAWEYIGVDLQPGDNVLELAQVDQFGNARGAVKIRVVAPGELAKIAIELPAGGGVADGKTPAKVVVKLTDARGVPVATRTPVTLEASRGKWMAEDLDPQEPGTQVFVEGGRGEFQIMPPIEPGDSQIVAKTGNLHAEARLDFLPELRNLVATGVIEGIVNMKNMKAGAIQPTTASDAFEQELRQISRQWDDGKTQAGARAAFYLKGKIKGDYLLTAAYDSDKDTQERLFRDIQPDEFYPVYGDSGQRGFDAQSTSKLYVRVDHNHSYLLWGDFTTNSTSEVRKLTNYSRSLTGVKEHFENSRVSVNAFASRDTTRQVIEELPANGTSGPFQLSTLGALVNSEKVEIITRDRNQPSMIISSVTATRFSDYEFETLTGRILFKAPVASVDKDLNPVFIRVTYEVDQGGGEFWVVGVDGQVKVTDHVEVGGVFVKDQNPLAPFTLGGANLAIKVGEGTYIISEVARTISGLDDEKGNAGRIEIKHEGKDFKADAYVARTDKEFNNPGAWLTQGRSESGAHLDYKLSAKTTLKAEALRTEDVTTGDVRTGASVSVQHQLKESLTLEVGMRYAQEKGAASPVPALPGQLTPEPMPDTVTTVRARVTGAVPGVKGATVYGEAEVDVQDAQRKVIAAGGEYELPNKSRIYARHEFISSITGPYGLNQNEQQNTTAIGIDTEYMKDGRLFSEYRIRDAMSGGDAEAAIGLRNLWSIAPGWRLGTTFERVHAFSGTGTDENAAATFGLEYVGSDKWKGSTRLELSRGATQETVLFTVGLAARVGQDGTALARNSYNVTRDRNDSGEHVIERMQAGFAYRDHDTNKWNALGRVEERLETDTTQPGVNLRTSTQIISLNADWQPRRPFLFTGRYAAKWTTDNSNGLATKYHAQVVGLRGTWEFMPKWDIGLVTSALVGEQVNSRQYGVGLEVGYLVATNLWVSAGYNFFGYRDADLAGADYTARGPFVRMRYKFDETAIEGMLPSEKKKTMSSEDKTP
jgi:uncharacterized repeat protein (TIGR01451 family)